MRNERRDGSTPASASRTDPSALARLGSLEAQAMTALWAHGGWLTPREVLGKLASERDLAYTTVMTILVRLWRKGMLERRKDGRAFVYRAVENREEWAARRMDELLSVAGDRAEALSRFVSTIPPADRDQLRRLLRI